MIRFLYILVAVLLTACASTKTAVQSERVEQVETEREEQRTEQVQTERTEQTERVKVTEVVERITEEVQPPIVADTTKPAAPPTTADGENAPTNIDWIAYGMFLKFKKISFVCTNKILLNTTNLKN